MPISDELKAIYANTDTANRFIECVSLSHSQFGRVFHLTNDFKAWEFDDGAGNILQFNPLPFQVVLPGRDSAGSNDMEFSFSNAGKLMMEALELSRANTREPIKIIYRVYRDIWQDTPQINPPYEMEITDVNVTLEAVNVTATRFNVLGRLFPRLLYSVNEFPGLKR